MGNPKPIKIGFWIFISSILSDVEKFDEFRGEISFQIRPKMAEISSENCARADTGKWKVLECTITVVNIYNTTDLHHLGGQPINVRVAESAVVKNQEASEPELKQRFLRYSAHNLLEKF